MKKQFIYKVVLSVILMVGMPVLVHSEVDEGAYFSNPKYTSPSISPDGKYFIQVANLTNQYRLLVSDLDKSEVVYNPLIGKGYPSNLRWISNRRVMYQQGGNLISMNIDGKEHRYVLKNIPESNGRYRGRSWYRANLRSWSVLHTLPGSPDEILTQKIDAKGVAKVYKTNLFTGEQAEIINGKRSGIGSWVVDKEGSVIAGVKVKKGKIDLFFVSASDAGEGSSKTPKTFRDKKKAKRNGGAQVSRDASFSSTGDGYLNANFSVLEGSYEAGMIYVSEALESDKFRLSKYSFIDDAVVEVIHEDADYDVGSEFHPPVLHFHENEKRLVGVTYYREKATSVWFDDRFKSIQSSLDKQYPDRVNHLTQWSDDLSKVLVYSASSNSLGKYYVFYPDVNRIVMQSDEDFVFGGEPVPSTDVVYYTSSDSTKHEGYMTLPIDYKKEAPLPLVVMVHGGPWARYAEDYDEEAVFFASKGYAVLRVNYRGSVGFGKNYFKAGAKNFSGLMLDDMADGAKWAIKEGYADPARVYIMGTSYGGYAALMSSIRHPDLYSAAVSLAAPLDLEAQIKHYKKTKNYYGYAVWNSAVGNVKNEREALKEASPIHNIDKLKIPYLVFHGENDEVVSVDQAESFKKALEKNGEKGKVYIIRREGHGFKYTSNSLYYVNKALTLFNQSVN